MDVSPCNSLLDLRFVALVLSRTLNGSSNSLKISKAGRYHAGLFFIPSPYPPPNRDCVVMSLRGSKATEAISQGIDISEIATLPAVARNDRKGIMTQSHRREGVTRLFSQQSTETRTNSAGFMILGVVVAGGAFLVRHLKFVKD
jgi:hypothetical protein